MFLEQIKITLLLIVLLGCPPLITCNNEDRKIEAMGCKEVRALWEKKGLYEIHTTNMDTIEIMECLLRYKGDTTLSVISGYTDNNKNRERIMLASGNYNPIKPATKQLAALYSISALYYSDIYFCTEIALEVKEGDKQYQTTNVKVLKNEFIQDSLGRTKVVYEYKIENDEVIQLAYKKHKKWFNTIKKIGLTEARKRKIAPLDKGEIQWVGFR